MDQKKHYFITTLGCQMNKSDSERLESIFLDMNLAKAESPETADVIIVNSCSVRQASEDKVYGLINNYLKLKKKKPNLIIGLTGCMVSGNKKGITQNKQGKLDLCFSTAEMVNLPRWLTEINPQFRQFEDIKADYLSLLPNYQNFFQAFIPIQTGCNHYCSYCIVPYSRGKEINRPVSEILKEIKILAEKKYLEVTLLGQIVNHYLDPDSKNFSINNPYKKNDFAKLLWEINQIENIERIHFTAAYPNYVDDELIDALSLPKQINFLHLPVQSGNNEILKKMNRKYTREQYKEIIDKVRKKRPKIAIGTDIIVGFSGETAKQFQDTIDLYKECDFDISYNAKYSPRIGTVAAKLYADDVSKEEKNQRWQILQKNMEKNNLKKNKKYVGYTVSVLVDHVENGKCSGNSKEMKLVNFPGMPSLLGSVVPVKITKSAEWILYGEKINT